MIHYFCTQKRVYILKLLAKYWAPQLRRALVPIPYESLAQVRTLTRGAYVFADLDRLSAGQLRLASAVRRRIVDAGQESSILNDPARAMGRYELWSGLTAMGINPLRIHRFSDGTYPHGLPAIVRVADDHTHSSGILQTREDVDRIALEHVARGVDPSRIVAMEFGDFKGSDGLHRSYTVMRVGPILIPRHLYFGRSWMAKRANSVAHPILFAEEREFVETNPHAEIVQRAFDHANLQWGSLDYGLLGDRVHIFEINTHPLLFREPAAYPAERLPLLRELCRKLVEQLEQLDREAVARPGPAEIVLGLGIEDLAPGGT